MARLCELGSHTLSAAHSDRDPVWRRLCGAARLHSDRDSVSAFRSERQAGEARSGGGHVRNAARRSPRTAHWIPHAAALARCRRRSAETIPEKIAGSPPRLQACGERGSNLCGWLRCGARGRMSEWLLTLLPAILVLADLEASRGRLGLHDRRAPAAGPGQRSRQRRSRREHR